MSEWEEDIDILLDEHRKIVERSIQNNGLRSGNKKTPSKDNPNRARLEQIYRKYGRTYE